MEFKFSTDLVNHLLGYLGTRPYAEVYKLLEGVDAELKAQGNGGLTKTTQTTETKEETPAVVPEVVDEETNQATV